MALSSMTIVKINGVYFRTQPNNYHCRVEPHHFPIDLYLCTIVFIFPKIELAALKLNSRQTNEYIHVNRLMVKGFVFLCPPSLETYTVLPDSTASLVT